MGTHLIHLAEASLMSTHNIGFYEDMVKIIFQLSSNIHFICSSVPSLQDSIRRHVRLIESGKIDNVCII